MRLLFQARTGGPRSSPTVRNSDARQKGWCLNMFHRVRSLPVLLAIAVGAGSVCVSADDWPQWRGPAGLGVSSETGLPLTWSDTERVAWRVKLPGMGVSTPVVAGDRVFVTGQTGSGSRREGNHPSFVQGEAAAGSGERMLGGRAPATAETSSIAVRFVVSAHRWSDGHQIWQQAIAAEGPLPAVHDKHNLATPSPVTDGAIVVCCSRRDRPRRSTPTRAPSDGRGIWARSIRRSTSAGARQLAGPARRSRDLPLLPRADLVTAGPRQADRPAALEARSTARRPLLQHAARRLGRRTIDARRQLDPGHRSLRRARR